MVNIGGRSNGCSTCRKRRVKCDEDGFPCRRCDTSGFPCEGYRGLPVTLDPHVHRLDQRNTTEAPSQQGLEAGPEFVMVDRNPTSHVGSSSSPSRNTSPPSQNGITTVITRPPRGRPRKRKPIDAPAKRKPSDQKQLIPCHMDLSAFEGTICVTFLVQNFLGHLDTGRKSLLPAWDVDNVSGTARDSVNALALAFFGKAHHHQNIIIRGAESYGKALRKLARDLDDEKAMWSSSVLLSSILLARYELVVSTESAGWIKHAGGVERLFELRGPRRHQSLEDRHIFEAARPIIAIKAITDCKRTFLDQPDWLQIPWAQEPGLKSSMNHLIDIFCIVPGLLEESKRLRTSPSFVWDLTAQTSPSTSSPDARQDPRRVALRHRTQECYTRLERWKESWDRTYPSAVQPVKISHFPRSELNFPEDIFSYAITFTNFSRANEFQLYNTVVFFLSSLMLSVPPSSEGDVLSSPSTSDLLSQRFDAAYDVCRAVPYDLFEKHGGGGAYLLLFPLLTNLRLFGEGSDEGRWIKQVLGSIANKWGLEGEKKYMTPEG